MNVLGVAGVPPEVFGLGIVQGLGYGLVAVALVVVFRATRVLNLALAQTGTIGALVLAELHQAGVPYWPALLGGLLAGALIAAATQLLIVERLRHVPPLATLIATLGVARLLLSLADAIGDPTAPGVPFAAPTAWPVWDLGALRMTAARTALVVLAPLIVVALHLFFRRTATGRGALAAGDDRDAALALGVPARRVAVAVCAVAGAVATLTAALTLPGGGLPTAEALGPGLLLRALAAAAIGGFTRPAAALAGGVLVGVIEQVTLDRATEAALIPPLLLIVVVVALVAGPRATGRRVRPGAWVLVVAARTARGDRRAWAAAGALLALAGVLVVTLGPEDLTTLNTVLATAIIAVSAWVATALTGQVTFAQVAIAGMGAAGGAGVAAATGSGALGLLAAPLAGAFTGGVLATAAGTNRDLGPAVVSLAFAIVAFGPLLRQDWALGDGVAPARLVDAPRAVAAVTLLALAAAGCVAARVARSSFGRAVLAARDNEPSAIGLGVPAALGRIQALAIAGGIAGVGGALLVQGVATVRADQFTVSTGFDVVAAAVVGGLGAPAGAVLGAALVIGLPAVVGAGPGGLVASSALWLAAIVLAPRGLIALIPPGPPDAATTAPSAPSPGDGVPAGAAGGAALELHEVSRRFGAVHALAPTSLALAPGEAVAVTGINGAGKTTLLEVAAGAEVPDGGTVLLDGRDVTLLPPSSPSRAGVVHLVQDGSLFPTATVTDAVLVGAERAERRGGLVALAGRGPSPRAAAAATHALAAVGLGHLAGRRVGTLSTGERRRVALAAALAAQPRLLLADEPAAGVAQAQRPALARLLATLRGDATLLLVDHDGDLRDAVAARTVALDGGEGRAGAPLPLPARAPARGGAVVLEARGLTVRRDGRQLLAPTDLRLGAGELTVVLGANGAGKTTLLRALAGLGQADGTVLLDGVDVSRWPPDRRARHGLRTLLADGPGFTSLTVGAAAAVATGRPAGTTAALARFPELAGARDVHVRGLSGGERQLLRVAQAALGGARVVAVDELSLGLAPAARARALAVLLELCDRGTSVVLADQDGGLAAIADRVLRVDGGVVHVDAGIGADPDLPTHDTLIS